MYTRRDIGTVVDTTGGIINVLTITGWQRVVAVEIFIPYVLTNQEVRPKRLHSPSAARQRVQ